MRDGRCRSPAALVALVLHPRRAGGGAGPARRAAHARRPLVLDPARDRESGWQGDLRAGVVVPRARGRRRVAAPAAGRPHAARRADGEEHAPLGRRRRPVRDPARARAPRVRPVRTAPGVVAHGRAARRRPGHAPVPPDVPVRPRRARFDRAHPGAAPRTGTRRASTTRSGSTDRCASTSGSASRRRRSRTTAHAAWPGPSSTPRRACTWRRSRRSRSCARCADAVPTKSPCG